MLRICLKQGLPALIILALAACARFPQYSHPAYEPHLQAPAPAAGSVLDTLLHQSDPQACGLVLLERGADAFSARLLLASEARQSLDLQYYLFHNDLTGKLFAWMLLQAADRGVRVRLLLDDMASSGSDDYIRLLNRHPNIHIRLFNPFEREYPREMQFITRYGISTRRMHNKSMVADNLIAVVGGRNIGDEYFDAARNAVIFGDLDVLAAGPVVDDVSTSFDNYWNSELAVPAEVVLDDDPAQDKNGLESVRHWLEEWIATHAGHPYGKILRQSTAQLTSNYQQLIHRGRAFVVADNPRKVTADHAVSPVLHNVVQLLDNATDRVMLISPYFIPGGDTVQYLASLVQRGVRVEVLTNSLASTDVPAVHSAYKQYRRALLKAGIILWELKPGAADPLKSHWLGSSSASLHAKAAIVDQQYLFIGSMNLDPRSAQQNTEMGMLIKQPQMAGDVSRVLVDNLPDYAYQLQLSGDRIEWLERRRNGNEKRYSSDPEASLWRQLQSWVLGFMPLESDL